MDLLPVPIFAAGNSHAAAMAHCQKVHDGSGTGFCSDQLPASPPPCPQAILPTRDADKTDKPEEYAFAKPLTEGESTCLM